MPRPAHTITETESETESEAETAAESESESAAEPDFHYRAANSRRAYDSR